MIYSGTHYIHFRHSSQDDAVLPTLHSFKHHVTIPRCVKTNRCIEGISLPTFCDASKIANSSVVFLRKTFEENIEISFIQAKSRVAPLKDITIHRLELLACCIRARLTSSIRKAMNLEDIQSLYWTDSSTALYWMQQEDHWDTFVNNRVEEIRNISSREAWKHLPRTADLPSRGCSVQGFLKSWGEPQWFKTSRGKLALAQCHLEEILKERKKGFDTLVNSVNLDKK
ncbi:uncharacterized protein TNIN_500691 [Trichonephila inaurata madagascariensis]|uniref:Uncharacterized protein n=1 Tax=Trichonephila inaurata madagascariensis TaxID=2747483 RepID=A0A8X6YNU3_9ARAC|nr:uncharacterized protein TNIN_500691 [Trichonephila inaurata madagascariensis]